MPGPKFFHKSVDVNVLIKFCANILLTSAAFLLGSSVLRAQSQCDSSGVAHETELVGAGSDYARLAELSDSGLVTPRLARRLSNALSSSCTVGPWQARVNYLNASRGSVSLVPISVTTSINTAYPEDRNNGAMWSGRGVAGALEGGLAVRLGPFSAGVIPVLTYQQNRAYELLPPYVNRSVFASALYQALDLPQRFGPKPYSRAFWGQSYARIEAWKFNVGFSTENVWWGPGISNAILFTNTAPGFPHVFINVRKPLNIGIGRLSLESLWGRLSESQYFDTVAGNNHRMVVGALIVLEPKWVPGLFLGFGRTFVMPWDSVRGRDLFSLAQPIWKRNLATPANPQGDRPNDDQRISLMSRYVLPGAEFEVYGEWAREDHAWDQSDFVQEPEHASGHLLGLQKLFTPTSTRWVRAYVEWANLQQLRQNRPGLRSPLVFYVHDPQGHTQLGQLLGASIGPGGESQLFGVDVLNTKGLLGFYTERVRRDEFSARGIQSWSTTWPPRHDVAITGGMRFTRQVGPVRIDSDLARSKRYNRNFLRNEWNTRGQLRVTWSFRNPAPSSTSQ